MNLTSNNSPLSAEQAEGLSRIIATLEPQQLDWLSGYLAGWRANACQSSSLTAVAQAKQEINLTVLFGSQSGNAEGLAVRLAEQARTRGFQASAVDMVDFNPRQLKQVGYLAVVTSTHGDGEPPDNALDLYEFLHGKKAPSLKTLKYGVLALGDSSYEFFCQTGKDFDVRLAALDAQPLIDRLDCDLDYEEAANRWIAAFLEALPSTSPAQPESVGLKAGVEPMASSRVYDRKRPFVAPVLENQLLSGRDSTKAVRHVELSLEDSGLRYQPGDALGVYARNEPALVEAVIAAADLAPEQAVSLEGEDMSLREALSGHREIRTLTRQVLEQWRDISDADSLRALLDTPRETRDWLWGCDLLDLLETWPAPALTAQALVDTLRKLAPRMYSISSSQAMVEDEVHITVAALSYEHLSRTRLGLASNWLGQVEDEVPMFIDANKNFSLPADDHRPIIMIGPGTGVAPFRAFLQEREARGAPGRNWLIFGERHFRSDFLYQSEWLAWRRGGLLTQLDVAFSRDQAEKRYVQHALRERGEALWGWLQEGASLYLCGDAGKMAADVHEALLDIAIHHGKLNPEAASDYLRQLSREKRYQRDVY